MITNPFSNPRMRAEIPDYPLGGSKRGICVFQVERDRKKGYRISRVTSGAPKFTTYDDLSCIVDGPNGRVFMLRWHRVYRMISIYSSKFLTALSTEIGGLQNTICADAHQTQETLALYNELLGMINKAEGMDTLPWIGGR